MTQLPKNREEAYQVIFWGCMFTFVLSATSASAIDLFVTDIGNYKGGFVIIAVFIYLMYSFYRMTINED